MRLRLPRGHLDLAQPVVMGVLNVTPDSFADGGRYASAGAAVERGLRMIDEGAAIVDVGGESTRPGATPVPVEEELRRVLPVVEGLSRGGVGCIAVDTSQPLVMRAAVAAGAQLLNDVRALVRPGAVQAALDSQAAVCLMHMKGEPGHMQDRPQYADVVTEVRAFLGERVEHCERAGIPRDRLCVDPGFGFGKTLAHNLDLLRALPGFSQLGLPVLVGLSRKRMTAELGGEPAADRLAASLTLAAVAVLSGAAIVRAHDVAPTVQAVRTAARLRAEGFGFQHG